MQKINALNKFEKDTLLWVEISLQKQHWSHLFALYWNAFGWDSHNKPRRIKSMMFTPWNLPINYCTIIKMCIFILICEFILNENVCSKIFYLQFESTCLIYVLYYWFHVYTLWVPTLTHLVLWSISILQIVKVFFFYLSTERSAIMQWYVQI